MELSIDLSNVNKTPSIQVYNATKRLLTEIKFKEIDFGECFSEFEK